MPYLPPNPAFLEINGIRVASRYVVIEQRRKEEEVDVADLSSVAQRIAGVARESVVVKVDLNNHNLALLAQGLQEKCMASMIGSVDVGPIIRETLRRIVREVIAEQREQLLADLLNTPLTNSLCTSVGGVTAVPPRQPSLWCAGQMIGGSVHDVDCPTDGLIARKRKAELAQQQVALDAAYQRHIKEIEDEMATQQEAQAEVNDNKIPMRWEEIPVDDKSAFEVLSAADDAPAPSPMGICRGPCQLQTPQAELDGNGDWCNVCRPKQEAATDETASQHTWPGM